MKYQFEYEKIDSCFNCPIDNDITLLSDRYQVHVCCPINDKKFKIERHKKPDWCPLQEVPQEQGRH